MTQFEDEGADLVLEEMIVSLMQMRAREVERIRQLGYAEYDHLQWRIRRTWQRLTRQKIMSRAKWNSFIDRSLE